MSGEFRQGDRFGPYRLDERLGQGTFGEVWRAWHLDFEEARAVKIPTDPDFVTQLRREGKIQHTLRHPNIVPVLEMNSSHAPPYVVMEFVDGENLRARLQREGRFGEKEALRVLSAIAEAVAHAHGEGILHRDLKPENVMLGKDGTVKVTDFGLGKVQEEVVRSLLLSGSLVTTGGKSVSGTFEYMSPEQRKAAAASPRDDVFALGVIACELLVGERPGGVGLAKTLSRRGVRAALTEVIEKACEDPDYRYADAGAFLAALQALPSALSAPRRDAIPSPPPPQALPAPSEGAGPGLGPGSDRPSADRTFAAPARPPLLPASRIPLGKPALAALVVLAVIVGFWLFRGQPGGAEPGLGRRLDRPTHGSKGISEVTEGHPFVNSLGMKFVPAGTPGVFFGIWETRVKDYGAFAKETNRSWEKPSFSQGEDHPAVNVSSDDAKAFCKWLSEKEGREYRLPKDDEWSVAVGLKNEGSGTPRAKNMKFMDVYPWGTQWPPPRGAGNYDPSLKVDDFAQTSPVGSFAPNRYGVYDMGGNAWEWCESELAPGSGTHVVRGGSWYGLDPGSLASSCRLYGPPAGRDDGCGFRCVLAIRSSR